MTAQPDANEEVLLSRFRAQGDAFEQSFLDDDWTRLEPFYTPDAVYETLGPGGERFEGRSELIGALRRAVAAFDRRCDTRKLITTGGPRVVGSQVLRRWACSFTLRGATDLLIKGLERAVYRDGQIMLLQERLTPRSGTALNEWVAVYASILRPRGSRP